MFLTTGQQIKQEREAHKMSQQEVATYVGYSRPLVADWEADRATPNDRVIKALEEKWRVAIIKRTKAEADELNNAKSFKERMAIMSGTKNGEIEQKVGSNEQKGVITEQKGDSNDLKDLLKCRDEKIEQDRKTIERLKMKLKEETDAKEKAENECSRLQTELKRYKEAFSAKDQRVEELKKELEERKKQQSNCGDLIVNLARYKNAFAKMCLEKMEGKQ